jgi:hypothetical protein
MTRRELREKCEAIYQKFWVRLDEGAPLYLALAEMRQRVAAVMTLYNLTSEGKPCRQFDSLRKTWSAETTSPAPGTSYSDTSSGKTNGPKNWSN